MRHYEKVHGEPCDRLACPPSGQPLTALEADVILRLAEGLDYLVPLTEEMGQGRAGWFNNEDTVPGQTIASLSTRHLIEVDHALDAESDEPEWRFVLTQSGDDAAEEARKTERAA